MKAIIFLSFFGEIYASAKIVLSVTYIQQRKYTRYQFRAFNKVTPPECLECDMRICVSLLTSRVVWTVLKLDISFCLCFEKQFIFYAFLWRRMKIEYGLKLCPFLLDFKYFFKLFSVLREKRKKQRERLSFNSLSKST